MNSLESPQRQIVAFMAVAMMFSIIGQSAKAKANGTTPISGSDVRIVLGAGIAAVLLVLLSEAGETGETFAKGLAALAMIASILINGKPVFTGISTLTSKASPAPKLVTTPKVG